MLEPPVMPMTPGDKIPVENFLRQALKELEEKGKQRDSPEGERSMQATCNAFNAFTGRDLAEEEGWLFMICLKISRAFKGAFRDDDYVDMASYSALLGECSSAKRKK